MSFRQYLIIVPILFVVSCAQSGIIQDIPVELVSPGKVVSASTDTTLYDNFPEVLNCLEIQIVNDTVLVLMDQANDINPYYFKVYSLDIFEYMGAFARKGRGPGEILSPYIMITNANERYLTLRDNSIRQVLAIDIEESIKSAQISVALRSDLPSGTFDCFLLPGSSQFRYRIEKGEIFFQVLGKDGNEIKTFFPYKGIDGGRYMTHFSNIMTCNGNTGQVADAMIFFPQINIFDTEKGTLKSIAVDKSYRRWESVLNRTIGKDTREYYVGATSSNNYIFAAYKDVTLEELMKEGQGTSIHVFDWEGNFLYDIEVEENVGSMTFDSKTKCLYCVEQSEGRVVRYDLGRLL